MEPRECPKYQSCSAPLCPLDDQWHLRGAHRSEPVCFYLCEYRKEGSVTRFEGSSVMGIYLACTKMTSDPRFPLWMTSKIEAASLTGSRWERGKRLYESQRERGGRHSTETPRMTLTKSEDRAQH
jgi:hypothetical protein